MAGALGHPRFARAHDELSGASDRVWLVALSTGLGLTLVAAYPFAHTPSGVFWAYAGLLIRSGLYLWSGDALRGRGGDTIETMFRVGLVAGLLEILVDWALIHWAPTGRLVYLTGNDVVMLGSPIWMPLAWACDRRAGILRFAATPGCAAACHPRAAVVVSIAIGLLAGVRWASTNTSPRVVENGARVYDRRLLCAAPSPSVKCSCSSPCFDRGACSADRRRVVLRRALFAVRSPVATLSRRGLEGL
jgi:hypothetical protein